VQQIAQGLEHNCCTESRLENVIFVLRDNAEPVTVKEDTPLEGPEPAASAPEPSSEPPVPILPTAEAIPDAVEEPVPSEVHQRHMNQQIDALVSQLSDIYTKIGHHDPLNATRRFLWTRVRDLQPLDLQKAKRQKFTAGSSGSNGWC
jgi:hypothetical protein